MQYKTCTKCKQDKDFSRFSKMPAGKHGLAASCKECEKAAANARREAKKAGSFVHAYDVELKAAEFKKKCNEKFPVGAFDYSEVEFRGGKSPVVIRCVTHDHKFLQAPSLHLKAKAGCPVCRYEMSSAATRKTTRQFIAEATQIAEHLGKYDYSEVEYAGSHEPVKIYCNQHEGYFYQTPTGHLSGMGCNKCGREQGYRTSTLTTKDFLEKAYAAQGDAYIYTKAVYSGSSTPLTITCRTHGDFEISPDNFYLGKGCAKCSKYGFNKAIPGVLYTLNSGHVTKVGITNREVATRLAEINKSSLKDFVVAGVTELYDGEIIFKAEREVKAYLASLYEPVPEKFDGSTECFVQVDGTQLKYVIAEIINKHKAEYDSRSNI